MLSPHFICEVSLKWPIKPGSLGSFLQGISEIHKLAADTGKIGYKEP